jgi:hypothetical protein
MHECPLVLFVFIRVSVAKTYRGILSCTGFFLPLMHECPRMLFVNIRVFAAGLFQSTQLSIFNPTWLRNRNIHRHPFFRFFMKLLIR